MAYRRFTQHKFTVHPATIANPATDRPPEPQSVAKLASVAGRKCENDASELGSIANVASVATRAEDFEERAALIEDGAGVPREWAEGFARLVVAEPLDGFSGKQWRQLLDAGGHFLDRFGADAIGLGWGVTDVFGAKPGAPNANYAAMGLVLLIGDGEVVRVTANTATIRNRRGNDLVYVRRPSKEAVPLWELLGSAAA